MRRVLLYAVAAALAAPVVLGQAQTPSFTNLALTNDNVAPGALVLAQVIQFTVPSGSNLTISSITVKNTATGTKVTAAEVEYIEVRRNTETGPVLRKYTVGTTDSLVTGIAIGSLSNNTFTPGTHRLYIFVKLKPGVDLGRKMALGGTSITLPGTPPTTIDVTYLPNAPAAATFTVALPTAQFDTSVTGGNVYRGQRFLAGRVVLNGEDLPFETTIAQLTITNVAANNKLTGSYLAGIEVRRASDDALLGQRQQTTGSDPELGKFTTTGVVIPTSSNHKVPPFSTVVLEIWVTLRLDAPTGRKIQLQAVLRLCGPGVQPAAGKDVLVGGTAAEFTVGEPTGIDPIRNLDLDGGQVFSGQRFLAQRIELVDFDDDPYDVTVNSLVVQNVATANRLSDSHVARIEVVRARDGAPMGQVTSASGLNSGGVRIPTANNNVIADDTTEVVEIWVTLGPNIPHDRKLRPRTVVWHSEDTKTFGKPTAAPWLEGPEFVTGPAGGQGLETNEPLTLADRTVFQGARFRAQRLDLRDNDLDPYDVTITSLMIRNFVPDTPLADQHVAKVEVRRKSDGALLGEVTDPVGLSLAGVRVTTGANNVVPDDSSVELEIWVTLKDTAPAGRKLRLESVVWHTEGTASKATAGLLGPAVFTTAIGSPPTGVDFSWTPEAPNAGQEVTFTPAAGITDPHPHGNIANATFSWNFGDGTTKQTTGSAAVKHTYTRGGTFSVTLTVTSEGGLSASKTRPIAVKGQEPTVDFTYTPASPTAGQEVAFTATVTDPVTPPLTPYTYAWNFGDGSTATVANPRHTYAAAGTYAVVLEVTNSHGETGRAQKSITVAAPVDVPPTVTALSASPANPEVGFEVTFTATATAPSGDPVTGWEWDFGDGSAKDTTSTGTAKHTYTASNVFTVTVRARNARGGWSGPRTLTLYVRPKGGALIGTKLLDNPARTQARIQVFLPQGASEVKIQVFDMLGRPLLAADLAGTQYNWNLTDNAGRTVADGLYFYLVTATVAGKTERSEVGRIVVVR